jgi:rare lipoprotein A
LQINYFNYLFNGFKYTQNDFCLQINKTIFILFISAFALSTVAAHAQDSTIKKTDSSIVQLDSTNIKTDLTNFTEDNTVKTKKRIVYKAVPGAIYYGLASYYANKFSGRRTAYGETFSQSKFTCACNILPLGTWIKVTNIRNKRSIMVKINDRIHPRIKRIVDLTKAGAQRLGFVSSGLTKVKVEVLGKRKPTKSTFVKSL